MPRPPDRTAEAAALRELLRVLELRPAAAARILGVRELDVATWVTGHALIPGDPKTAWVDVAKQLVDAVQAVRRPEQAEGPTPEVEVAIPPEAR